MYKNWQLIVMYYYDTNRAPPYKQKQKVTINGVRSTRQANIHIQWRRQIGCTHNTGHKMKADSEKASTK